MASMVERRPVAPVVGRALAWAVVLVAVAAGARYGYGRYEASKAASAAPQYFLQPASVGPVVETVTGSGTFGAASTTTVTPQVAGTVRQIDVQVGQTVRAGQTLFQMADTTGLAGQLAAAQAQLQAAEANLKQLQDPALATDPRTITLDRLQVQQAQLNLQTAQANLQQATAAAAAAARVTTPVAGTVQAVDVTAGTQVGAGTVVATVVPAGPPTVTVSVPQAELPYLPLGTSARIVSSALGVTASGQVIAVAPAGASASGTSSAGHGGSGTAGSGSAAPGASPASAAVLPLTVSLSGAAASLPNGADVSVTFTPQGSPPATDSWSDGGTVVYPAAVPITAQQAGVISGLAAVGAAVQAGQQLATVTPTGASTQLTGDQNAVTQDQYALQQAQDGLQAAESPPAASAASLAAAQNSVALDQQAVATDQQDIADLAVTAPVAGIVQSVSVEPGTALRAGASTVTLQSAGPLQAVAEVDELAIAKVKPGQTATVTVPAYPTQTFQATVTGIAPDATTQFGVAYFPVSLSVQGLPATVRSGMTLNATILIRKVSSALRVPAWAVTTFGAGNRGIVRVMQGGRPTSVPVTLGVTSTRWDQVVSGLAAGDEVIAGDTAAASSTRGGAFFFAAAVGGFRGPGGRGGGGGPRGG